MSLIPHPSYDLFHSFVNCLGAIILLAVCENSFIFSGLLQDWKSK